MEWKISESPVAYEDALAFMEQRVAAIRADEAQELVWLLEHPPLYTAGSSAKAGDLLDHSRFPVYEAGRGGEYTYHGPGQRVAYVMLDLQKLFPGNPDLRAYIKRLEGWVIGALTEFGVDGFVREGRIGVWVHPADTIQPPGSKARKPSELSVVPHTSESMPLNGGEKKIAAIGVRVRRWVSYHGIAINVHPNLEHYTGIVPCGIREYGVTSLHALGKNASMAELDAALKKHFRLAVAS